MRLLTALRGGTLLTGLTLVMVGCSGGSSLSDTTNSELPDSVLPDDAVTDSVGDGTTDLFGDTSLDGTDGDVSTVAYEVDWTAIPLGATGDLHRARYLEGVGFRLVGAGGSLLRPLGQGWIRMWTPYSEGALRDVTVLDGVLHAVGDEGVWLRRDDQGRWLAIDSGVVVDLHGVAATATAVVGVGGNGVIVKYRDGSFEQEFSGVSNTLYGVASAGTETAHAVGEAGVVVKRKGYPAPCVGGPDDLCNPCALPSDCAGGMCESIGAATLCTLACGDTAGACPENFFCTDSEGGGYCKPNLEYSWEGQQATSAAVTLRDILVLDSSNIWAVGSHGAITKYSGGTWQTELSNDVQKRDIFSVGGGSGLILSTGSSGLILKQSSNNWSLLENIEGPLLTTRRYEGIAIGPERVVAAGEGGALQIQILPTGPFQDGYSRPKGAVLDLSFEGDYGAAVGEDGLFVVWDEQGYGQLNVGVEGALRGVHVLDDGTTYAVGDDGVFLHWSNQKELEVVDLGISTDLYAVRAVDSDTVIAVGANGTAISVSMSDQQVTYEPTPDPRDLMDLFQDAQGLVAVGKSGAIVRRQGDSWSSVSSGTTLDLYAGSSGEARSVVVGAHGIVLEWPHGGEPTRVAEASGSFYYDVAVQSDGTAIMVGWAGDFLRLSADNQLTAEEAPTSKTMRAVSERNGKILSAGDDGGLWERTVTVHESGE